MQAVSLSFFRFDTVADKLWAFSQMQWSRGPLRTLPGIGFCKLFGSGSREGFHPSPNFSVYGILGTWPALEHGCEQVASANVYRRYRERASESWTVYLSATRCRGRWANAAPFDVHAPAEQVDPQPVAVLTRATISVGSALAFWRRVPDISGAIRCQEHLRFKIGLGEVPWLHQVTFSIWDDVEAMKAFAYAGFHGDAIKRARDGGWFREELFARFRVLNAEGSWEGRLPLPTL